MNNQYAKFKYKGMKTVGATDYTSQTPPKYLFHDVGAFWEQVKYTTKCNAFKKVTTLKTKLNVQSTSILNMGESSKFLKS